MSKPFFTLEDFTDAGGYLKNPEYCVKHANEKVEGLFERFRILLRMQREHCDFLEALERLFNNHNEKLRPIAEEGDLLGRS